MKIQYLDPQGVPSENAVLLGSAVPMCQNIEILFFLMALF